MGAAFWIRRFVVVLAGAFAVICTVQLAKGHRLDYAAVQAAIWAAISASVFTVARFFQARRGQHCALCKDTPEMQGHDSGTSRG
jgi:hypothetical protein